MTVTRQDLKLLLSVLALALAPVLSNAAAAQDAASKDAAAKGVAAPDAGAKASPPAAAPAATPGASTTAAEGAQTGLAAVYNDRLHGRKTASGEIYDRNQLTAAHPTLAFGTRVKVTHAKNGKSVTLRINDRGPTQAGRILDISPRAAKALGMSRLGMAEVKMEVVEQAPAKKR